MLGNVAETGTSNIFMVKDGVVFTPAPNGTFLSGITRSRAIKLLREAGIEVVRKSLTVEDFMDADEIFSTGNHSKVVPVIRIEDRELQPGRRPKTRELYMDWAHSRPDRLRRGFRPYIDLRAKRCPFRLCRAHRIHSDRGRYDHGF